MTESIRKVQFVGNASGYTLEVWDAQTTAPHGQSQLRYEFRSPAGIILFEGDDYGVAPSNAIDSDAALLGLLSYLTLRDGDTDSEYFERYTPEQRAWSDSSKCEYLQCDVTIAEEAGGCVCDHLWTNLDGWTCDPDERGNVLRFQVVDHGEDGSQYFPGCGIIGTDYEDVATGVGDTATEALDDALDSMAQNDVRPSKLQEFEMRNHWLTQPSDKSAFASLDHSKCGEDHETDDWQHYVSIRYTARKES